MSIVWVILGAMLLIWGQDWFFGHYWDKNLTVGLSFSEESAVQGETCELCERVENEKWLPLPALKVKFQVSRQLEFVNQDGGSSVTDQYYRNDVMSVRSYTRHVRRLPFTCKKRGYYVINGLDIVAGNFFLNKELPRSLKSDARLYVYPKPCQNPEFMQALQKLNGEVLSKRHLLEDPFEYRGIREYSPHDTMREINWKATARTGELMVNMKNYTALKAVRIFLNLEDAAILRQEDLLETAVSMAAGAAELFLNQGIRTALYTNGADILTGEQTGLEAASGAGHMETVNRALARIDLNQTIEAFVPSLGETVLETKEAGGAVFTLFFSPNAREDFQELLCKCLEKNMDFAWICPAKEQVTVCAPLESRTTVISVRDGEVLS